MKNEKVIRGVWVLTPEIIEERTTLTEKKLSLYRVKALLCMHLGNELKVRGYWAIIEAIKSNYYPVSYESE